MTERTDAFVREVQEAMENIISFWTGRMADPRGGFYGRMDGNGNIETDAPKGVILNARILWALSAAYRVTKKQEYLLAATRAKDYFIEHFFDHKYGGVYWTLDATGTRLDTHKQAYAQGFAIYAISEYVRATKDQSALRFAQNLYLTIEKNMLDSVDGGYLEAKARDWSDREDMRLSEKEDNWAKSFNTHLHILEPYTNLYRVWPDQRVRASIINILNIFTDKIYNPVTGHFNLFFDKQWNSPDYGCSYGHEVEAGWLMLEAAFKVGDIDLINKVRPVAEAAVAAGMTGFQPDGSLIYECHADGSIDTDRHWWVQAETVVANLWKWKYTGDPLAVKKALRCWDYIKSHLVSDCGEWFWRCSSDGKPYPEDDLAGLWKCPYHNTRMCTEVLHILKHQAL